MSNVREVHLLSLQFFRGTDENVLQIEARSISSRPNRAERHVQAEVNRKCYLQLVSSLAPYEGEQPTIFL